MRILEITDHQYTTIYEKSAQRPNTLPYSPEKKAFLLWQKKYINSECLSAVELKNGLTISLVNRPDLTHTQERCYHISILLGSAIFLIRTLNVFLKLNEFYEQQKTNPCPSRQALGAYDIVFTFAVCCAIAWTFLNNYLAQQKFQKKNIDTSELGTIYKDAKSGSLFVNSLIKSSKPSMIIEDYYQVIDASIAQLKNLSNELENFVNHSDQTLIPLSAPAATTISIWNKLPFAERTKWLESPFEEQLSRLDYNRTNRY